MHAFGPLLSVARSRNEWQLTEYCRRLTDGPYVIANGNSWPTLARTQFAAPYPQARVTPA